MLQAYHSALAKAPENILPVIMGKHQNVIRMANFMKFHLVISYHIFFLAEMTHKELLAFFASGAQGIILIILDLPSYPQDIKYLQCKAVLCIVATINQPTDQPTECYIQSAGCG